MGFQTNQKKWASKSKTFQVNLLLFCQFFSKTTSNSNILLNVFRTTNLQKVIFLQHNAGWMRYLLTYAFLQKDIKRQLWQAYRSMLVTSSKRFGETSSKKSFQKAGLANISHSILQRWQSWWVLSNKSKQWTSQSKTFQVNLLLFCQLFFKNNIQL